MEKMKDLCSIKTTLVDSVKEQLSHGIDCGGYDRWVLRLYGSK